MAEPDTEDGTDAMPGRPDAWSRPPWNPAAANAAMDAHEGLRRLAASLRVAVTGRPGPRRGGSDTSTAAAIEDIENFGSAVTADAMAAAARILDWWSRQIQELRAVDESEPWRRVPATCPYCGFGMLRVRHRSGEVTCLRYGVCGDANSQHPVGRMDVSRLNGNPVIRWNDGLVT
jgi:hypothetical protein